MTRAAKTRIRRFGSKFKRNLATLRSQHGGAGRKTPAERAIRASVAKNLEALRILARE